MHSLQGCYRHTTESSPPRHRRLVTETIGTQEAMGNFGACPGWRTVRHRWTARRQVSL